MISQNFIFHLYTVLDNARNKIKEKKWIGPLGKGLEITGFILETAGDCGVPVVGLIGQILTVGADLLDVVEDEEDETLEVK